MKKLLFALIGFWSFFSFTSLAMSTEEFIQAMSNEVEKNQTQKNTTEQNSNQTSDEKVNQNNKKDFFTDFADQLDAAEARQQK